MTTKSLRDQYAEKRRELAQLEADRDAAENGITSINQRLQDGEIKDYDQRRRALDKRKILREEVGQLVQQIAKVKGEIDILDIDLSLEGVA